jgi:phosphotransferase system  glucose/maltose/N-acetylglucosamine-specific IIC component
MLSAVFALDEDHLIDLFIYGCLLGGLFFLVTGAYAVAAALFGSFIGGLVGFLVSGWPSQHDHDLYSPIGATLFLIIAGTLGLAARPRMGRRVLRIWGWTTVLVGLPATLVMVRFTSETLCRSTPPLCMTSSPATLWPWTLVVLIVLCVAFLTFLFFAQSGVAARGKGGNEGRGSL